MFVEFDHTSSGVQIAAALTRDRESATNSNITNNAAKADIYIKVAKKANKAFKAAGIDVKLERADVKKAVIAKVYGGGVKSTRSAFELATGLSAKDNKAAVDILEGVIVANMSGVVTVQKWFTKLVKAVHDAGHQSITVKLTNGIDYTVKFKTRDTVADDFDVRVGDFKAVCDHVVYRGDKIDVSGASKTLVAGFIQGFDAYILAKVQVKLAERGVYFLAKHDAYLVDESDVPVLLEIVQKVFHDSFQVDHLADIHRQVAETYGVDVEPFDAYGDYKIDEVLAANFMVSE